MAARPTLRTPRAKAGPAPDPDATGRAPHPVYGRIKSDILSLALAPGQDLDESSLSRRYGVSRTPVREALIRLSAEHLVELTQSRARVSALILADYPRFIEALDVTRRSVARLAAHRRHATDVEKLRAAETAFARAAREASPEDAFARSIGPLEYAFHIAVSEAGHNRYLTESYRHLLTVGHRMLRLPYAYDARSGPSLKTFVRTITRLQRRLVDAIETARAAEAEAAAAEMTDALVGRLRGYLEENLLMAVKLRADLAGDAVRSDDDGRGAGILEMPGLK